MSDPHGAAPEVLEPGRAAGGGHLEGLLGVPRVAARDVVDACNGAVVIGERDVDVVLLGCLHGRDGLRMRVEPPADGVDEVAAFAREAGAFVSLVPIPAARAELP